MRDVGFLLLAGGQSRRMGGGDKNQLHLGGKSVMQHVLDRVDRSDAPTVINANGDPKRFNEYGLPVIADVVDGYAGPLAGILTGLEWMAAHHSNCTHLVSMATDAPFLPTDLALRLYAETRKGFFVLPKHHQTVACIQFSLFGQFFCYQIYEAPWSKVEYVK